MVSKNDNLVIVMNFPKKGDLNFWTHIVGFTNFISVPGQTQESQRSEWTNAGVLKY